jgi:hypothetical protein
VIAIAKFVDVGKFSVWIAPNGKCLLVGFWHSAIDITNEEAVECCKGDEKKIAAIGEIAIKRFRRNNSWYVGN